MLYLDAEQAEYDVSWFQECIMFRCLAQGGGGLEVDDPFNPHGHRHVNH